MPLLPPLPDFFFFPFSFLLLLQWRASTNNATNFKNKEKTQDLNLGSAVNANKPE